METVGVVAAALLLMAAVELDDGKHNWRVVYQGMALPGGMTDPRVVRVNQKPLKIPQRRMAIKIHEWREG